MSTDVPEGVVPMAATLTQERKLRHPRLLAVR
jgi:hypothetical protein